MYYSDPEGNDIEMQVDNFDTPEEANDFMNSKLFAENPNGTDFDPEELVKKVQAGENQATVKKSIEIGPWGLPDF
jgi:catechol-2,3-dioxygenase